MAAAQVVAARECRRCLMENRRSMIELKKIVKRFYEGKPNELEILHGIDLTVKEGEFVSIVGESGSGKSTLMNILGLLDTCDSGTYMFSGLDTKTLADNELSRIRNERIGFIFQSFNLIPTLSVVENVALPLTYRGIPTAKRLERSISALEAVGLSGRLSHKPYELSGGQQQRVAIARAYAAEPEVLLMDEPFGALDAQTRTQLQTELLETWQREKKTCFFITHDVEEAIILAQTVIIMSARPGRIRDIVKIDIPYPRTQETKMTKEFMELKNEIWSQVYQEYLEVRK